MYHANFTPFVRFARKIPKPPAYPKFLYAYDHRLVYMISGEMEIVFENAKFEMSAGSVAVFPPALPYKMANNQLKGNEYVIINFDFTDKAENFLTRPPDEAGEFDESAVFSSESFPPFHEPFFIKKANFLLPMIKEICREANSEDKYSSECASSLMKNVIFRLMRCSDVKDSHQSRTERAADQIKQYIDTHYAEGITNISIAKEFGYHPYYVNSFFVKFFHVTLHGYITSCRLRAAEDLLLDSNMSIGEIASTCGFKNEAYFSETFKKHLGIRPSEFRNTRK